LNSIFEGNPEDLCPMQPVEFSAQVRNGKTAAEFVRPLPVGSIKCELQTETLTGYVGRTIRCLNPDQDDYCGFINECKFKTDPDEKPDFSACLKHPFAMLSLCNPDVYVYEDDPVTFQLACLRGGKKVAFNVHPVRERYTVSECSTDLNGLVQVSDLLFPSPSKL
jgi:hypothetical protein